MRFFAASSGTHPANSAISTNFRKAPSRVVGIAALGRGEALNCFVLKYAQPHSSALKK